MSATARRMVVAALSVLVCAVIVPAHGKFCKLQCKDPQPKLVNYGFDNAMQVLEVDVGACPDVYTTNGECDIPPSSDDQECHRRCQPRAYELHTRSNRDGPFTVQSIKSCFPTRHHCLASCERKPNYLYLFPDSKYQTRVDVGKCTGQCMNDSTTQCKAVRTYSLAVEGPNGYVTVDTIQECGCVQPTCYRADYFVSYSEQFTSIHNNTTSLKRRERVINVGKCVGSCEGVIIPGYCAPSPDNCVFRFPSKQGKCVPTAFDTQSFTSLNNEKMNVTTIVQCGCSTG